MLYQLGSSTVSIKGQVVIPIEVRKKLHINPGTSVVFLTDEHGKIYLDLKETIQIEKQIKALEQGEKLIKKMKKNKKIIDVMKDFRNDGS